MSDEPDVAPNLLSRRFARIADGVARATGHPLTFVLSCIGVGIWALSSMLFHVADAWQSLISTAMTMITFLMVFLIQSTQNRGSAAVQAKLDELIRALEPANNKFIGIERRAIEEVYELRQEADEEVKLLHELVDSVREGSAATEAEREPGRGKAPAPTDGDDAGAGGRPERAE